MGENDVTGAVENGQKYLPDEKKKRKGIALCLSGGGYRSALFHLGALRRLNELGILSCVDTISSVSGGSILSAHLAERLAPWPEAGTAAADWEGRISRTFHAFTARDIRTWPSIIRVFPLLYPWPTLASRLLKRYYYKRLTRRTIDQLPERPRFVFCATDILFGVNFVFEKSRVGDYQAGYIKPAPAWPLAYAVAASSSFPPVFDPIGLPGRHEPLTGGAYKKEGWEELIKTLRLSDGGVYDNLGTEPVWKDHSTVLVSDGGAAFKYKVPALPGGRVGRVLAVINKQSEAVRRRWLVSNFKRGEMNGTYWGIGGSVETYLHQKGLPGYPEKFVKRLISRMRTDLDPFSKAEVAVLENHGYLLADASIHRHMKDLVKIDAPLEPPYPEWLDVSKVEHFLKHSHKRVSVSRWWRNRKLK